MSVGWETVAISLGGSAITAVTAAGVAIVTARAAGRREFVVRRLEAAAEFDRKLMGAFDAREYANKNKWDRDADGNARWLLGEVRPTLGPLSLLFLGTSPTVKEAERAFAALRDNDLALCTEHRYAYELEVHRRVPSGRIARFIDCFRMGDHLGGVGGQGAP